jgi:hypothetical protein
MFKLRALDPGYLAACLRLPSQYLVLPDPPPPPSELLDTLAGHELLTPCVRLFAYALPEREAVWWACMCCIHTAPQAWPAAEQAALDAAERWVRRPEEATRRDAARAAAARVPGQPGFWTAHAAAWAVREADPAAAAPRKPSACGRAVEAAVTFAALRDGTRRRKDRLARFITSGRDIAAGGAGRLPREVGE